MADLEKAKKALMNAHNAGDKESARKIANYIKENQVNVPELSFGTRGVASALGAPADLTAAAIGYPYEAITGREFLPDGPVGGRKSIESGIRALGGYVPPEGAEPQTIGGSALQVGGEALGAVLPLGMIAKTAQKGSGIVGNISKSIMDTMAKAPKRSIAAEGAAGLAAGAGGYAADYVFPDDPMARPLGEITGAMAPAVATKSLLYTPSALMAKQGKKLLYEPFTNQRGMMRAEDRMQGLTSDKEAALSSLEQETISNLTPAQKTGQKELLELEAAAASRDPALRKQREEQLSQANKVLQDEMAIEGYVTKTRGELETRTQKILNDVDAKKQSAIQATQQKLEQLAPAERASQSATILRQELENSFQAAKAQENALWEAIPGAGIPTQQLKSDFKKLILTVPKAQRDDLPSVAYDMLGPRGKFRAAESLGELQGLRSKLLEESRLAKAAGQYNKARLADKMADSVLDQMGAKSGQVSGPVGEAVSEALQYSRKVAETYRQGAVGKILSHDRMGADKIPPEMTLESIIGAGKIKGDVGAQQILNAADTPEARQSIQNYMLGRLNETAVKDGVLNPTQAETFLRQNEDILDKFPDIRQNLTDAVKFQREANRQSGRLSNLEKSFVSDQKSNAAIFLNADIDKEIVTIMRAQNPAESARQISSMVRGNEEAQRGLKAAATDYVFNASKTKQVDDFGNEILSGNKMISVLNDNRKRQALKSILGDDGIDRLQRVADELQKLEKAAKSGSLSKIIDDKTNIIFSSIARIYGAALGRALGTGTIQVPAIMSKNAQNVANMITQDKAEQILINAVYDEDLFKLLMSGRTQPKMNFKEYNAKLNAWMASTGFSLLDDDDTSSQKDIFLKDEDEALNQPVNNGINNKQEVR